MNRFKKPILVFLFFMAFCMITVTILSFTYEGAVIRYLKKYLDKHLTTEIEVGKIRFSVIKKFPNASIELKQILAKSSSDLHKKDFKEINTDTLLYARSVFFEFSLPGLIRGKYHLKNISVVNGKINLFTDNKNFTNFDIWESGEEKKNGEVTINLQNITFSNVSFRYFHLKNDLDIISRSKKLQVEADLGNTIRLLAKGNILLDRLKIEETIGYTDKPLYVEADLNYKEGKYHFNRSRISFNKSKILFSGDVFSGDNVWVDLVFSSNKAYIRDLSSFFPEQLNNFKKDYTLGGYATISGWVKGNSSARSTPSVNVNFSVSNAMVSNNHNKQKVSDLSLKGNYLYKYGDGILKVNDFYARLGKSNFSGNFSVTGNRNPLLDITLNSQIDAKEFTGFFNIDTVTDVSGEIAAGLTLKGKVTSLGSLSAKELLALDRDGQITVKDLSFGIKGTPYSFAGMNGSVTLGEIIKLRDLSFRVDQSDFTINCNLSNFYGHFLKHERVYAEAEIYSTRLDLGQLMKNENGGDSAEFITFPDSFSFKANFSVKNLQYGKFSATDIFGAVTYKPKTFQVHSFQLNSVDGAINGVATISQDRQKITRIECAAALKDIDIQKLFYSFNNFSQDVILEENLKGKISGKVNVISAWDGNIHLLKNTIEAYTDIEIQNGELVNYAPMLGLSKFIAVDELKDIKFKTLKNQIIIKDQTISIPEMAIQSSAINIRGSGVHTFDNTYEYRIQVKLSDLLTKKARKKKKDIDEFGFVEEDGSGINIPIKITGTGDEFDVGYDRQKAFSLFKQNISEEKKELKNLVNENKSTGDQQLNGDNQKKEFIIEWDEENGEKDFIFDNKDKPDQEDESQIIIEWDE